MRVLTGIALILTYMCTQAISRAHTYTHKNTHSLSCPPPHMHTASHAHVCICTHQHAHTHAHTRTHIHIYSHTHTHRVALQRYYALEHSSHGTHTLQLDTSEQMLASPLAQELLASGNEITSGLSNERQGAHSVCPATSTNSDLPSLSTHHDASCCALMGDTVGLDGVAIVASGCGEEGSLASQMEQDALCEEVLVLLLQMGLAEVFLPPSPLSPLSLPPIPASSSFFRHLHFRSSTAYPFIHHFFSLLFLLFRACCCRTSNKC